MKTSEGHVRCFRDGLDMSRGTEYVGRRMLRTELPGRRKTRGVVIVGEEVSEKKMQG